MPEFATYPSLRGRSVFVSGGGSGIGASIVEHFAAQGAKVGFVDINEPASKQVAAKTGALFQKCDITDTKAYQAAIAEMAGRLGPITVLVNNAAHDERHKLEDVTPEFWDDRIAVNLRHAFFAIQAVVPGMKKAGGGSIINFSSISYHTMTANLAVYQAAKAATIGMTRGLARDLGGDRIRLNSITPGWIMTQRQIDKWLTPEAEAELMKAQVLKEKVYPPDIARMVLFLAADDSRLISAQTFVVDGGRM
jgi:NAD(P)-dependent dehydrogenase (short-subunit alcohol dehydrogenase family)